MGGEEDEDCHGEVCGWESVSGRWALDIVIPFMRNTLFVFLALIEEVDQ